MGSYYPINLHITLQQPHLLSKERSKDKHKGHKHTDGCQGETKSLVVPVLTSW